MPLRDPTTGRYVSGGGKDNKLTVDLEVGLRGFVSGLNKGVDLLKGFNRKASAALRTGPLSRVGDALLKGPGGLGGAVAGILQLGAKAALLPLRIAGELAKAVPYAGDAISGIVGMVGEGMAAILNTVANLVGHVIHAVERLVGVIIRIVTSIIERIVKLVGQMVGRITKLLSRIATVGSAAFLGLTALAVRQASKVQDAWNEVRTILDLGPLAEKVQRVLRDLAVRTGRSVTEVISGYYQVVSAGFTEAGEALRFLEAALFGAIGGGADFPTVVLALSRTMRNFRIGVDQATLTMDKLLRTVDVGQITLPELAEVMGPLGNAAASLGVSLEDTLAAMGILAQTGPPAVVATQLRGFFLSLAKGSEEAKKALADLNKRGIDLTADALRRLGLPEYLRRLQAVVARDPNILAELFPDRRAFLGIQSLLRLRPQITAALGQISDAAGKTQRNLGIRLDSLSAQWRRTWQAIKDIFYEYGKPIADVLQRWLEGQPDRILRLRDTARAAGESVAGVLERILRLLERAGEWLGEQGGLLEGLKAALDAAWAKAKELFSNVKGLAVESAKFALSRAWDYARELLTRLIVGAGKALQALISDVIRPMLTSASNVLEKLSLLQPALLPVAMALGKAAKTLLDAEHKLEPFLRQQQELLWAMESSVKTFGRADPEAMKGAAQTLLDAAKEFWGGARRVAAGAMEPHEQRGPSWAEQARGRVSAAQARLEEAQAWARRHPGRAGQFAVRRAWQVLERERMRAAAGPQAEMLRLLPDAVGRAVASAISMLPGLGPGAGAAAQKVLYDYRQTKTQVNVTGMMTERFVRSQLVPAINRAIAMGWIRLEQRTEK